LKNLLYSKIANGIDLLDMNEESKKLYLEHAEKWDNRDLLRVSQIVSDVSSYINRSDDPYLILEITALKLLEMDKSISLDKLLLKEDLNNSSNDHIEENKRIDTVEKPNASNNVSEKSIEIEKKEINDIKSEKTEEPINKNDSSESAEENVKTKPDIKNHDLDIDTVKSKWESFIDKVHIKKPSIASILDKSVPLEIINGVIDIKISSALDFHVDMIENNSDVVNDILCSEFGTGVRFVIKKESKNTIDTIEENKTIYSENSEKDEQLRDKIIDLFDGEILT
jgi:DNA polymerase III gamma/tau subunit